MPLVRTTISPLRYWDRLQRHETPPLRQQRHEAPPLQQQGDEVPPLQQQGHEAPPLQQQREEAPPFQQQRKGRPKGRRSRNIAHSDEAIQQMIHERANERRSLKAEVAWVVKILEKHDVKIEFGKDGRCKSLERQINEAWEAASRA